MIAWLGQAAVVNLFFSVVIAVLVLLTTLFIYYRFYSAARKHVVLLVGCSDAGKTALFSRLICKRTVNTVTSISKNNGQYDDDQTRALLIDIPGNEKIRSQFFESHKGDANGIIFVVDSLTIQSEIRDVAEFLYSILVDPVVRDKCKRMLILCNKQDLPMAKGQSVVRFLLEKELNVLRSLKSKQLDSTTDSHKKQIQLGSKKKEFHFSQMPFSVECAESVVYSPHNDELNFEAVTTWLNKL